MHGEGGAARGGYAETGQQRFATMGAGPHGNTIAIENCAHIVGMGALHLEGDNAALVLGVPENPQPLQLAEAPHGVSEQRLLMGGDGLAADAFHIVCLLYTSPS